MTTTQKKQYVTLVAGRMVRLQGGKKMGRKWYAIPTEVNLSTVTGAPPTNDDRIYGGKLKAGPPGVVRRLEIDPEENGTVLGTPGEYVGMWGDDEWKARMNVEDRALRQELAAEKREKAGKQDDPLLRVLLPLQRMYSRASAPARAQLLMRIVFELQKGSKK